MDIKRYRQIRIAVAIFISIITSIAVNRNSLLLATTGVLTGMLFMAVVRSKTRITVDERDRLIGEKAARLTYAIFTPTIGLGSFFLIVFARGEYYYLESLGTVLAYLTLYLIALYALFHYFLSRKFGGGNHEE